ncbi:MAG: alpha/beta fold hydrolase [Porticoccaceae bacterium]|jgi:2-hydroxy-6-oxonona-2,4-dienedioate hydrolase|nr:alpha/beta fold hydrolase [Porticoccaceae bacterium]MBT3798889.1 alpha/beta fold hydrolase [Porticoccaceae bacterium]MBT4163838.1 alpha/beta fold hydrolase [Porticoccaceae bacterium]MBT4211933.1 alpha/beta fold hydrolase [Porticoccaceae bacterium]MBT4592523.1 alpha/beta fold hydrolase [Porticoccaceae bacterium]
MSIWTDLTDIDFRLDWINAGGVKTRALIAGEGEDVIFMHGTSGHLEAFCRNIVPHVKAGFKCHAIDALGHGYTDKPDSNYEIPKYGKHVLDYMDAQGIKKAHFAGESLGGWIAGWLAIHHPRRVKSLQLIAAGGTKANPEIMQRIKESTTKAVKSDDIGLTRKRLHLLMFDGEKNVSEELVQVRHAIYHQPNFVKNIHNLLCMQEMPIRQRNLLRPEDLAKITAPTLVIWGRENPFGDVPEAHKMHKDIAGSRLELFEECGHWPQHERPELYNPLAIAFLNEHSG